MHSNCEISNKICPFLFVPKTRLSDIDYDISFQEPGLNIGAWICNSFWICMKGGTVEYLRITRTNQNWIHEKIKSRLKSGNVCYHSVQNLLSSSLLSKNVNIKIYSTTNLPVSFLGVKLGHSHWGRNVGWGYLRMGCWGGYLVLRGTR